MHLRRARAHRSMPMQLVDVIRHKLKINTHWEDYYRFGFYRKGLSWEQKSLYLSARGSRYWPYEANSLKFDRLFNYKGVQKALLTGLGLPTPRLLVMVGRDHPVCTREAFAAAMAGVDRPFVTKPDGSLGGRGVMAFDPVPGGFRCEGELVSADWIWAQYADRLERGFLVEERARNHPGLAELHPGSLNTMRIPTVKTRDGRWHVLRPYLKMGRGGSAADNSSKGGIFAGIGEDGVLGPAYSSKTWERFESHPDTGAAIAGRPVPMFEEAKALARRASHELGFMGTIGWDVGVTPDGPTLVEGNALWDPTAVQDVLGPFLTPEVAAGLMPRSWWTPWDRTHMYPFYEKDAAGGWLQRRLAARRRRWQGAG